MKIFIKYKNKQKLIETYDYQSIASIINKYLENNDNNDIDINNYFIDYNGAYLNCNFSLEKYNIQSNSVLTLNDKNRGGNSFFSFAAKHPATVALCFLIALLPVIILPMGYVPSVATLIKIIIQKAIHSIGKYLVCVLGKSTLFSRLLFLTDVNKYLMFILMIFVIITFPLIVLCITLKGHSIMDNPKDMCSAVSTGNKTGMILTIIYILIYFIFRCGNFIFNPIINLCKKTYITNTLFVPIFKGILSTFNTSKYIGVFMIPFIGAGISSYFTFLSMAMKGLKIILSTIIEIGCKTQFSKEAFMKSIMKKVGGKIDEDIKDIHVIEKLTSAVKPVICKESISKCCSPNNYINIADSLSDLLKDHSSRDMLKSTGLYPTFIIFIEAFYESALSFFDSEEDLSKLEFNEKKMYLRKIMEDKMNILSNNTKDLIDDFLSTGNETLINQIKKNLETHGKNDNKINDIKYKLALLDVNMVEFAKENDTTYVPGKSLFKTILKIISMDIFCNVSSTAKTSDSIITEMGSAVELTDMLKAGTATRVFMSIIYLITFIALIICGIFNIF